MRGHNFKLVAFKNSAIDIMSSFIFFKYCNFFEIYIMNPEYFKSTSM